MKGMNELTPLVTQPKQFYFFSTRFRISSFFPPFFQLVCSPSMRGFFGFFNLPPLYRPSLCFLHLYLSCLLFLILFFAMLHPIIFKPMTIRTDLTFALHLVI